MKESLWERKKNKGMSVDGKERKIKEWKFMGKKEKKFGKIGKSYLWNN